jgi:hypothetical protein
MCVGQYFLFAVAPQDKLTNGCLEIDLQSVCVCVYFVHVRIFCPGRNLQSVRVCIFYNMHVLVLE